MSDDDKAIEDRAARFLAALAQHSHALSGLDDYVAHRLAVLMPHLVTNTEPPGVVRYTVHLDDGSVQSYELKADAE